MFAAQPPTNRGPPRSPASRSRTSSSRQTQMRAQILSGDWKFPDATPGN